MNQQKTFDNFPFWIPLIANLFSLSIYAIGFYIFTGLGLYYALLFLLYCLVLEVRVLKMSCVDCYYYGKVCGLGKGKLCSLFFKKGVPERFIQKKITWKAVIPDLLVFIVPLLTGIFLLILDFNWLLLIAVIILFLLGFGGNGIIRGSLVCKFCKQRELFCPAEQLFQKGGST